MRNGFRETTFEAEKNWPIYASFEWITLFEAANLAWCFRDHRAQTNPTLAHPTFHIVYFVSFIDP